MRYLILFIFLLISCGKDGGSNGERCRSMTEMRSQCLATELAQNEFNTDAMIDNSKAYCAASYPVESCY